MPQNMTLTSITSTISTAMNRRGRKHSLKRSCGVLRNISLRSRTRKEKKSPKIKLVRISLLLFLFIHCTIARLHDCMIISVFYAHWRFFLILLPTREYITYFKKKQKKEWTERRGGESFCTIWKEINDVYVVV